MQQASRGIAKPPVESVRTLESRADAVRCAISPAKLAGWLVLIAVLLTVASLTTQFIRHILGHGSLMGWVRLLNVDAEANIPSWYSSVLLLFAAVVLAVIGFASWSEPDPFSLHWKLMAGVFFWLSIDEIAQIHETFNLPLRHTLDDRMTLPWVLPAAAFVVVFALFFLRFLFALPPRTRWLLIAAGSIYVSGAIGMELVSGHYAGLHGENMTYELLASAEELLEMLGVIAFIYALTSYMASRTSAVRLTF